VIEVHQDNDQGKSELHKRALVKASFINQINKTMHMIRCLLLFIAQIVFLQMSFAQEKLLYATDFQEWTGFTSTTEKVVTKKTDFSNENLDFKFYQVNVDPAGENTLRFNYSVVSKGWAQAQKVPGSYIELSPLQSVTKVQFIQGATGTNRGFKLSKKGPLDLLWIPIYTTPCATPSGELVTVTINESNVALRFTNIDDAQNAYMFDLKIYGNYVSTKPQYRLDVTQNIPEAGTITKTPYSDTYDQGMSVKLEAKRNFGYKFVKWVDSLDVELSTANPYNVIVDVDKKIKAIFDPVPTYTYVVNIEGSKWGQVQLTPQPTNGKYEEGTQVSMKVVPNPVTNFSYWNDHSTTSERVVTVDGNKSFTATFDEIPFIVGWNFKAQTPTINRAGDFYSETTNTGLISAYDPNGSPVSWLANSSGFSPSYPNIRLWTPAAEFKTKRRYLKANFSTVNYKNIQVTSMVSASNQAYSVQLLQYSLDNVNFKELARVDIADVYNSAWKQLNATLPVEAEGKDKIYIRWIADETSPILGESTSNNDGTAFTNVFVFADTNIPLDTVAPVLLSTVPASGSHTASINGSVVLNFNEKVKAGTGNITLGSSVLTGTYGSKTASFKYEKLNYDTEYTFTVPAGALTDISGNPYAGITITFRTGVRAEPTKKLFDAVVAKDGSGDYTSIIDAIAAAPSNRAIPWLIYIKNGKYTGHHDIPSSKPFIHLIGQNRDSVIISDNRLCGEDNDPLTPTYPVNLGATMVVNSSDCYFENITIENSYGYEKQAGPQALALYTEANRFATNNCYLRSYQDTYLTTYATLSNRHYLKNTRIEGAVDFIYGGGDVFFDKCTITCTRKDGGYIVAPSHATGTAWGYVFSNCTIDEAHASGVTTYFGRPWHNAPKTVFLYTTLKAKVYPEGWYYKMGAIPAIFADYATMDANGNMVDLSQRIEDYEYEQKNPDGITTTTVRGKAKKSLTDAEAATYTYENVILRSVDNWDPRMIAEAPAAPSNVVNKNSKITWDHVLYSRLYIIFRNGKVVNFTINNEYSDMNVVNGETYSYAVQTVSEYGALSAMTNAVDDTIPPVVKVKNIAVALDSSGKVSISADMVDNGSYDAHGIDTLYLDKTSFDCSTVGDNQVTLTVRDKNGNGSSATAVVTVKDGIAPVVLTKNIELSLVNGSAVLKPSDIDAGSGDACGISTMRLSRTSFDCSNIGAHSVLLTVTDKNGNSSSASALVTIKGSIPTPTIAVSRKDTTYTGTSAHTIFLGYGAQSLTLTATDGSSTGSTSFSWSPAAGLSSTTIANSEFTPASAGTYTLQATAVNENGCSASTAVTINVVDARCGDMMDKVFVCHYGQPICINTTDVKYHLAHGCKVGACDSRIASLVANDRLESSIESEQKSIQVYPIPASDLLNVQFELRNGVQYRIGLYDLKGVLVQSLDKGYTADNAVYFRAFDVSRLPAGIYVLRVTTNNEIITKKVVIQ
jgi:pectin methylesterase-like acyl-CoA thioesterase